MPGILSFSEMDSDEEDSLVTVVTCEGNITDPDFPYKLSSLVSRLRRHLVAGDKPFHVTNVEPWNSVRVTFTIPREAAQRLRQLAQQGDRVLRDLGILSVQVEGDQVISLTIAGRFNEPQEVVLQQAATDEHLSMASSSRAAVVDSVQNDSPISSVETTRKNIAQYLSQQGSLSSSSVAIGTATAVVANAAAAAASSSSAASLVPTAAEFKSPNVVAPGSEPIPFPPKSNIHSPGRTPPGFGPFPFASMTHAMNTMQSSQNHQVSSGATSSSSSTNSTPPPRFPFSPPPFSGASLVGGAFQPVRHAAVLSRHVVATTSPSTLSTSSSSTTTVVNNFPRTLAERANAALASPLLVNLLQSDVTSSGTPVYSQGCKIFPPPLSENTTAQKRKRKPRKSKTADGPASVALPSPVSSSATGDGSNSLQLFAQPFSISLPSIPLSPPPLTPPSASPPSSLAGSQCFTSIESSKPVLLGHHRGAAASLPSPPPTAPSSTSNNSGQSSQETEISPWPSPTKRTQHLVNPFTGQLEPMSSEDDSTDGPLMHQGDPFLDAVASESTSSGHFSDIGKTSSSCSSSVNVSVAGARVRTVVRELSSSASSSTSTPSSPSSPATPSSTLLPSTSGVSPSEKIKLRLKLEPKVRMDKEDSKLGEKTKTDVGASSGALQYKVDVSFVNIPTSITSRRVSGVTAAVSQNCGLGNPVSVAANVGPLSASLVRATTPLVTVSAAVVEPRVPPLHISLRGRNATVVSNPRRDKLRTVREQNEDGVSVVESVKSPRSRSPRGSKLGPIKRNPAAGAAKCGSRLSQRRTTPVAASSRILCNLTNEHRSAESEPRTVSLSPPLNVAVGGTREKALLSGGCLFVESTAVSSVVVQENSNSSKAVTLPMTAVVSSVQIPRQVNRIDSELLQPSVLSTPTPPVQEQVSKDEGPCENSAKADQLSMHHLSQEQPAAVLNSIPPPPSSSSSIELLPPRSSLIDEMFTSVVVKNVVVATPHLGLQGAAPLSSKENSSVSIESKPISPLCQQVTHVESPSPVAEDVVEHTAVIGDSTATVNDESFSVERRTPASLVPSPEPSANGSDDDAVKREVQDDDDSVFRTCLISDAPETNSSVTCVDARVVIVNSDLCDEAKAEVTRLDETSVPLFLPSCDSDAKSDDHVESKCELVSEVSSTKRLNCIATKEPRMSRDSTKSFRVECVEVPLILDRDPLPKMVTKSSNLGASEKLRLAAAVGASGVAHLIPSHGGGQLVDCLPEEEADGDVIVRLLQSSVSPRTSSASVVSASPSSASPSGSSPDSLHIGTSGEDNGDSRGHGQHQHHHHHQLGLLNQHGRQQQQQQHQQQGPRGRYSNSGSPYEDSGIDSMDAIMEKSSGGESPFEKQQDEVASVAVQSSAPTPPACNNDASSPQPKETLVVLEDNECRSTTPTPLPQHNEPSLDVPNGANSDAIENEHKPPPEQDFSGADDLESPTLTELTAEGGDGEKNDDNGTCLSLAVDNAEEKPETRDDDCVEKVELVAADGHSEEKLELAADKNSEKKLELVADDESEEKPEFAADDGVEEEKLELTADDSEATTTTQLLLFTIPDGESIVIAEDPGALFEPDLVEEEEDAAAVQNVDDPTSCVREREEELRSFVDEEAPSSSFVNELEQNHGEYATTTAVTTVDESRTTITTTETAAVIDASSVSSKPVSLPVKLVSIPQHLSHCNSNDVPISGCASSTIPTVTVTTVAVRPVVITVSSGHQHSRTVQTSRSSGNTFSAGVSMPSRSGNDESAARHSNPGSPPLLTLDGKSLPLPANRTWLVPVEDDQGTSSSSPPTLEAHTTCDPPHLQSPFLDLAASVNEEDDEAEPFPRLSPAVYLDDDQDLDSCDSRGHSVEDNSDPDDMYGGSTSVTSGDHNYIVRSSRSLMSGRGDSKSSSKRLDGCCAKSSSSNASCAGDECGEETMLYSFTNNQLSVDIPSEGEGNVTVDGERRCTRSTRSSSIVVSPGSRYQQQLLGSGVTVATNAVNSTAHDSPSSPADDQLLDNDVGKSNRKRKREDSTEKVVDGETNNDRGGRAQSKSPLVVEMTTHFYSKPVKRKCSENAVELIKACIGVDDNPKRASGAKHINSELSPLQRNPRSKDESGKGKAGTNNVAGSEESSDDEVSLSELATKVKSNRIKQNEDRVSSRNAKQRHGNFCAGEPRDRTNSRSVPNNRKEDGRSGRSSAPGVVQQRDKDKVAARSARNVDRNRRATSPLKGLDRSLPKIVHRSKGRDHERLTSSPTPPQQPPPLREDGESVGGRRKLRSSASSIAGYYDTLPQKRRRMSRDHR